MSALASKRRSAADEPCSKTMTDDETRRYDDVGPPLWVKWLAWPIYFLFLGAWVFIRAMAAILWPIIYAVMRILGPVLVFLARSMAGVLVLLMVLGALAYLAARTGLRVVIEWRRGDDEQEIELFGYNRDLFETEVD